MNKKIGILALQGCVKPHRKHLEALDIEPIEVRFESQLEKIEGLILPGGESTVFLKLLDAFQLEVPLKHHLQQRDLPTWGICAGAILMANKVTHPTQASLGLLPMTLKRNAYGPQVHSFQTTVNDFPVLFIRAPRITEIAADVEIKAWYQESPVWVQKGRWMATTFHPELSSQWPSPFHRAFIELVQSSTSSERMHR